MKPDKLADLARVTKLQYQIEYEKVRVVIQEEMRVRANLSRLDNRQSGAGRAETTDLTMNIVGADVLWQGWVAQARRDLNLELAGILTRKPHAMDRVRSAFGRQQATEQLRKAAEKERLKRRWR